MISNKCQKVSTSSLSEDRVSGNYFGFTRNDPSSSAGKVFGNNKAVPPISYKRPSFSERDLSTNWETAIQQLQHFQLPFTSDPLKDNIYSNIQHKRA